MADKVRLATATLCGCFGCHMSLLDIDERILQLVQLVEFDRSPFTDIKTVGECDIGLIRAASPMRKTWQCCASSASTARCWWQSAPER